MKKLINFLTKITTSEIDKLNSELKANKVCNLINDLKEIEKDDSVVMWLNPSNQRCFNFGYFTHEDFYDWLEGKGKIVKGETDEEKAKFWEIAKFESEHDYGWAIGYYLKDFKYIDDKYVANSKKSFSIERSIDNKLVIKKDNHAEIISKIFGEICRYHSRYELKYQRNDLIRFESELFGAKQTLFNFGIGYYGASNMPEDPLNLNWIADICKYKSVYLNLLMNDVKIPDYEFLDNYNKFK